MLDDDNDAIHGFSVEDIPDSLSVNEETARRTKKKG